MKKHASFAAAFALLATLAFAPAAKAEGIDCKKATTEIDKLVCAVPDIVSQDTIMAELYVKSRISMFGQGISGEVEEQKKFLNSRRACLKQEIKERTDCLLDAYKSRNLDLAFANMPAAPEVALKVLHDQKNATEPFYQALVIYASEPDGTDWTSAALTAKREKIETSVDTVFKTIQADTLAGNHRKHFEAELLEEDNLKSPKDILKSGINFAKFLRVATFGTEAKLPCGYVVSHPDLITATDAYFGATPDNFIINTNCTTTAPATPKFQILQDQINKHWPECDGTIRFFAFRTFAGDVDRVLSPSALAVAAFVPNPKPNASPKLVGVSKTAIKNAEQEMAAYYVKYLGAKPAKAIIFAKGKIADVLYDGQQCE